jgi:hypothetical protein
MIGPIIDITIIACVSSKVFNFTPEAKIHIILYILQYIKLREPLSILIKYRTTVTPKINILIF